MTNKSPRLLLRAGRSIVAASCLGLLTATGYAAGPGPREFGVRSIVADPTGTPRQVYSILSVQMFSSDPRSMPQVDEDALMRQVCGALDGHGFRQVEKGQSPEILITVHYGRAWLRNPYLSDKGDNLATEGISSVATSKSFMEKYPNQDIVGAKNPKMDGLAHGYEPKVQKAAAEKLYLRLTGWKYPPDPKAKAERLWQTTVVVDDPDRWNLNAIAGGMLAAGAPYFNREIEEKELEVHSAPPEGLVKVGSPQVVGTEPAKPAPAVLPPAAADSRPVVAGRKFDLPAGDALLTLQAFSRQSGEEIIYPVEQVRGIKTNEVHGEMSPRAALDRLLDGTGLSAVQDEKSEALAVRPSPRR